MKITELNITEFGCFKDKVIALDSDAKGLNIIYGENESGKSTVLLFIKFMLYGIGRKSVSNSERERSLSWSGHTAAGSMSIVHGKKAYRIERRFNGAVRNGVEQLSFVCLDSGEEIKPDTSVGEYLLGVPREVFESSACVGQLAASEINGDKTSASIQNMLTSADESVDTSKILKQLDKIRVNYRYKSKSGGSLYEDEQKIAALKHRLDKAREDSAALEEQTKRLADTKAELELTKADFDTKDALVAELNKIGLLRRFERLHHTEASLEELLEERRVYVSDSLKTDFFPSRSHTAELKLYADTLERSKARLDEKQKGFDKADSRTFDCELAALGERAEAEGGIEELGLRIGTRKAAIRSARMLTAVFSVLGAVGAIAGILLLIFGIYAGAAAFAALIFPVAAFISGMTRTKKLRRECEEIYSAYGAFDETALMEKLADCQRELQKKRDRAAACSVAEAELNEALKQYAENGQALEELLLKTAPRLALTVEAARNEYARLEDFIARCEKLDGECAALKRVAEGEKAALAHYNEQELRESIGIDASAVTPVLEAEAQRQRSFLLKKKEVLEQKLFAVNDYVVNLRANVQNPLPIADELAELEEKYRADSEFYDALTLAMESIEDAGETMRGNVMPAIAKQAGELLSAISDDKYNTIRTSSNMALTVDSEGYGIKSDYLSGGTRDAAYLSLRIALFMRIFEEELPPLVLDEALCQIDDIRAERILTILSGLSDGGVQCLLFTSHRREAELCTEKGIAHRVIGL